MNAKRIAELARISTPIRGAAIYALIACTALASTLFSCSQPPAQQQPTPPPTPAIAAATTVPPTHTSQPPTAVPTAQSQTTPLPTPTPITPTPQPTTEPTPTPTATPAPNFLPLPTNTQFTQITAGKYHACGLQADGTALCWGNNINGSLNVPVDLTFRQISAGLNFACGIRANGAIACWGRNNMGQASPPDGRFDEITAGRAHACALNNGALTCWGRNFPDGAETIQEVPLLSAIQAGYGGTCGLTPDADMACWISGLRELAITPGPFADIGIGLHHACAIRVDGSAFCRENIEKSKDYSGRSLPPPTKFIQISGGWYHACGITETSDIECWGSYVPGEPGERLSAPEGKFAALAIGWRNSCALRPNGHAVCWRQPDFQNPSELQEAFGGIEFENPVELFPLQEGRLAVVEREGIITAYSDEPNASPPETMLDLTDQTICCEYDNGMLSAALDPQFEEFPFLYVYYRTLSNYAYGENEQGVTIRVSRFRVESGKAIRDSELTILDVAQPKIWHYGGAIRFGADGMLYVGIGYNSSYGRPQSLDTLRGKIIRIDVRGSTHKQPYRTPLDNPFVDNPDALPEIWAYGLRNPWRMDFAPDGKLFIGDVGVDRQESLHLAAAGANLGYPLCEGGLCEEGVEADAAGFTAPIFTYGRDEGCAIIGGVTASRLNNGFIFGDYCSRRVWILEQDGREGWQTRLLAQMKGQILSFGIDADGTVYVLTRRNPIMRLHIDGE